MKLREKIKIGKKIVEGAIFKKYNIISVEFGITNKCNLSCRYCIRDPENYIKNEAIPVKNEMSLEQIKIVLSMLNKLNVERINISGGEPLVRGEIAEILESVFLGKFKASLTTNGTLVPRFIDLLVNLDFLIISIDGAKETHDYIRGKDTYESVLKAIDLGRQKGIKMIFSSVITSRTTEQDLSFLLKLSDFYDVFCICQPIWDGGFYQNGYVRYNKLEQLVPSAERLEYLYRYLENEPNRKRMVGGRSFIHFILGLNKKHRNEAVSEICMAGKLFLYIAPNGSIFPCSGRFQKLINKQIYDCYLDEIKKMQTSQIKCPGCTCYSYWTLNKLMRFDLNATLHSFCNRYI